MSSAVSLEYLNDLNLFETEAYHYNLSTNGATANIPIENITYRLISNGSTLALYLAPATAQNTVIDYKRIAQYDGGSVESTYADTTTLVIATGIDPIIYTDSREFHMVRLRQQNPATGNWDICDISLFSSAGLSRVDVFVKWIGKGIVYGAP